MANMCSFQMIIKGEKPDRDGFINALTQKGRCCMGRGAEISESFENENDVRIYGWCKWSVASALYDNAFSMREQKNTGKGRWYNKDGFINNHIFVDLVEATEIGNLDVEVVSWESGMCFSEHYHIRNGKVLTWETTEYTEIWDEETGELIREEGGFKPLW